MSNFLTKFQERLVKHIEETIEDKIDHLVINRQMPNDDVHWHRGYIAAYKELGIFAIKELPQKMSEE